MLYQIEVFYKEDIPDAQGEAIREGIRDLGIERIRSVRVFQLYHILCGLSLKDIDRICRALLIDPITQSYRINPARKADDSLSVEVWYKKGVTDNVAGSVRIGIRDLGIGNVREIKTGSKYIIRGDLEPGEVEMICNRLLANNVIQEYIIQ